MVNLSMNAAPDSTRLVPDAKSVSPSLSRFGAVRKQLLGSRLDAELWRKLAENVREFEPDVVVLLARRLPRMYQLLSQELHFGEAIVISDFAIMFLEEESLHGKKIAVVDDSVNVGTSLANVCNRLEHLDATVRCFAIACKNQENITELTQRIISETTFVLDENKKNIQWDAVTYQNISKKIAAALSLLNRPYEIEYPVFHLKAPNDYAYQEMIHRLNTTFPQISVHRLGLWENLSAGLERFSVDRENTAKWRIYVDQGANEVVMVPMLSHEAWQENRAFLSEAWAAADVVFARPGAANRDAFEDESLYRLRQFMTALHWGCSELPELLTVLGLHGPRIVHEDVHMLFGPSFAAVVCRHCDALLKGEALPSYCPSTEEHVPTSSLWTTMQGNEDIKKHFAPPAQQPDAEGAPNNAQMFINFFLTLGNDACEATDGSCSLYKPGFLPRREDVDRNPYLRLRAGVTLADLHRFMAWYWGSDSENITPAVRHRVSILLDQQIDQGLVVPVIGVGGQRVLRKGEPSPYDRFLIFAMQQQGIVVSEYDAYEDIQKALDDAPPTDRDAVRRIMTRFDQHMMAMG